MDLSSGITDEIRATIKEHGSQRQNEEAVTASFYFDGNAPNLELAVGGLEATSIIQEALPVAAVWASPDGRIQFIQNPR